MKPCASASGASHVMAGPSRTLKHELPAVEDERQHHRAESLVELVELALCRQSHVDRSQLDLLGLLGRTAELVVGKDHDPDRAVGALLDSICELPGGDVGGVILLREMREAQRQRRRARDIGRRERQYGGAHAGLQKLSAIHDILPDRSIDAFVAPHPRKPK